MYAELLSMMIAKSGKSLGEIVSLCKSKGVKFSTSYLSRLQTGKTGPGSEKINRAVAEVLGEDPELLVFASQYDRTPPLVKRKFDELQKAVGSDGSRDVMKVFISENFSDAWRWIRKTQLVMKDVPEPDSLWKMASNEMEPFIPEGALLELDHPVAIDDFDVVVIKVERGDYIVRKVVRLEGELFLMPGGNRDSLKVFDPDKMEIVARVAGYSMSFTRS